MLNREDGMGISDTFPLKLALSPTHHNLSHADDKAGQLDFAKYDLFLSEQLAYFFGRLQEFKDKSGSVLDNSIVLYGSGANMGLRHGNYWRKDDTPMSNLFLSILHSMEIEESSFANSSGTLHDSILSRV